MFLDMALDFTEQKLTRFGFGVSSRIDFYESLALQLTNDVKLIEALQELQGAHADEQSALSARIGIRGPEAVVIQDCIYALTHGGKLATALQPWVSVQEVSLIAAGERSGQLVDALDRTIEAMQKQQRLIATIRSALSYPIFIGLAIIASIFYLAFHLVPELMQLGSAEQWAPPTQRMIAMGTFVTSYWPFLTAGILGVIGGLTWLLPNLRGPFRDSLENWPIFSIYRVFMGSSFLLNIAVLLQAGVPLQKALELMGEHANPYLGERIDDTLRGIRSGATLGKALQAAEHNFPDQRTVRFLCVLSGKEGFEQALERFTERWLEKNFKIIERSALVIRLVLMLIAGYVIFVLFQGIYGISQSA